MNDCFSKELSWCGFKCLDFGKSGVQGERQKQVTFIIEGDVLSDVPPLQMPSSWPVWWPREQKFFEVN